ncbi:MAG: PqqD family protein [Granulosicoccus sp.]|nr:PqqD family protein [Granulosicoccus sp.]
MSGDKITRETVVVAREDLLSSDLSDDELVMMDIDKGHYYGLEGVAKAIWAQLASARPVSDICAAVVAQFDADNEAVEKDTIDFLTELHKENLINILER